MAWQLVSELGLHESHRTESARRFPSAVCYPTYAAQAADGTYVIAEERGVEKQVPFRFECRTIRMDVDRRILFDSHELGFEDAHGCLVDDGGMAGAIALLRRTRWQLLFVAPTGDVVRTIELQNISKRLPRYVVATGRNTLLIVFYNRAYDIDVAEIDYEGQLRWYLPSHVRSIGIVGGLELTADDTILVADPFRHVICEVSRTGNVLWQFGTWDHPASDLAHCSNPSSVTRWRHGRRLVADTRNHRILSIDSSGAASPWPVEGAALCDPVYVRAIASGNVLVCDAGNACVRELDREGRTVWQTSEPLIGARHLSYPRSIVLRNARTFVVADTGNDRIVEYSAGKMREITMRSDVALFWPRCARVLSSGALLVADARNGRIIEISASGEPLRTLGNVRGLPLGRLSDPHDVRQLPNGHLLVTDSPQDCVLELDWTGMVHHSIGLDGRVQLKDPHSADVLPDGRIVVADTGHNRLLVVHRDGTVSLEIEALLDPHGRCYRLRLPRYAELYWPTMGDVTIGNAVVVIADTGHNRILGGTIDGRFLWQFDSVSGAHPSGLNQPRWATLVNDTHLLVSDHFHHRIVHAKLLEVAGSEEIA